MSKKLWVVRGTERSQGMWRVWPHYVLAGSSLEAEERLRDYEAREFESVVARYEGVFNPKQLVREWRDMGKDIVKDLREEGIADLFWWELIDGQPKLCGVLEQPA
jgi:hypothetical protein